MAGDAVTVNGETLESVQVGVLGGGLMGSGIAESVARAGYDVRIYEPIATKDRSGFIVNMLLVPYLMAAVRMYEQGFASSEDIDTGMALVCGHPMGPLTLCDFIGLDVLYAVCRSLYEEFKQAEYAPPPLMKRMLAAGRLGRKSGRGFYAYGKQAPAARRAGATATA